MPTSLVVGCVFCLKNDKIVCKSNNCFIYIFFFSSSLISVARIKYSVRSKTMWGVQGFLTYTSRSQFIMEKSQSRNLRQETGRSEPTVSPSSSLLGSSQDLLPKGGANHSALGAPTSIDNRDNPLQTCPPASLV